MNICLVRIVEFFDKPSSHPRDVIPSFELLTIATMLRNKNHTVSYLDNEVLQCTKDDLEKLLLKKRCEIYIFHFQPIVNNSVSKIIKRIKKKKRSLVLAFGPSADYQTNELLLASSVDFALLGEPEQTAVEIIKLYEKNKRFSYKQKQSILGAAFIEKNKLCINKTRPLVNPDDLPFLAHDLIDNKQYRVVSKIIKPRGTIRWGFLLSSRGCPYNCTFCAPSIRNSVGKPFRFQSIKRTVDEIEYLITTFSVNAISFEDDIFTFNDQRIIDLCEEIVRRKLVFSWTAATRLDRLNETTVALMKIAGCTGLSAGVESGSDRILKLSRKGVTTEGLLKGAKILERCGVALTTNFIVGHPTETLDDILATMKFARQINPALIHLHYMTPYPGTELYTRYKDEIKDFTTFSHWRIHEFNASAMSTEQLKQMVSKIYKNYYFSFTYLKTYMKYRLRYWLNDPIYEFTFIKRTVIYLLFNKS